MATHKRKSHSKGSRKSHKASQSHSHNVSSVLCPKCKKMVGLKESKIVEFKVNGHTRKRLAGVGECGHKVSRFMKSDA